jgi:FKBP-type peptidyl-prolyl cis-trans isomerase
MFSKFELLAALGSIGLMALALFLVRVETNLTESASGQAAVAKSSGIVFVNSDADVNEARADAFRSAVDSQGNFERMVIDDVKIGTGAEVKQGDDVSVHYVGTLQNGQEFDNSRKRGSAFEFTVGTGEVIKGWDEGLVGMKVGGQRILVIPPEKAYGENGVGPIPGGATLVFMIELLAVK